MAGARWHLLFQLQPASTTAMYRAVRKKTDAYIQKQAAVSHQGGPSSGFQDLARASTFHCLLGSG
jgi:hypothetical protein